MKKIVLFIFLFVVGMGNLSAQKAASKKQAELKKEFEQFKKDFDCSQPTFVSASWWTDECQFYQLKWVENYTFFDRRPSFFIEIGDKTSICGWDKKIIGRSYYTQNNNFLGLKGKYALIRVSIDANNDVSYYYERNEEQYLAYQENLRVKREKSAAEQLKRQDSARIAHKLQQEARELLMKQQDSLQKEFALFVEKMEKESGVFIDNDVYYVFPYGHSRITDKDKISTFQKDCNLYQLKWSYYCNPGMWTSIVKGDDNQLHANEYQLCKYGATFSADGKYAFWGRSIPMGTCDDEFHYYERVEKK